MSFFSEDRAAELKEIFFESAQELLQTLNEEALELEKRPGDTEIVRSVRRTIHTLKGDSAACGYRELSELAHELEDVLTPELAQIRNGSIAEVVLSAADTFHAMLAAYRGNLQPPSGDAVRQHVLKLINAPAAAPQAKLEPRFAWSEYERMVIADSAAQGNHIFHVALRIDPNCPMRAAAMQMIRNVMSDAGAVLVMHPDESTPPDKIDIVEMALASAHDEAWIARKSQIPAIVNDVIVQKASTGEQQGWDHDVLELGAVASLPQSAPTPAPAASVTSSGAAAAAAPAPETTHKAQPAAATAAAETSLRVEAERIDAVLDLVGELIIGKSMLVQTIGEFDKRFPKDHLKGKFADAMAFQARVLHDLQKSVMKIRMVPVEQLFRRVPRIIRDIAKTRGKEVALQISGQDTDLDKSILDTLAEPLTHLVRNAVDHGLESPEERAAAGKPAAGIIRLNAFHQGNQVVIEVADDGRGIDREKVVAKAIAAGIITADDSARMSEGEQLNLIFHPGLSTADKVTEVSGRGVGMDVVKSVLERLKGSVGIQTKLGEGATFQMKVPLTLAIIKALLFRVADRMYAVPLGAVLEITRASEREIHRVDNHEVIQLRDQVLTLVRLSKLTKRKPSPSKKLFIVVIAIADRRFGLVVDKLVGEEELVIKAMDDHLVATELVSGASILGDGTVVLILNIPSVVARLGKEAAMGARA